MKIIEFANRLDLDEMAYDDLLVHCMPSALSLMGILSGEATLSMASFASLINRGQLLKKRICSFRSKFFVLIVDPIMEGLCCPGKQVKVSRVLSHSEMAEEKRKS